MRTLSAMSFFHSDIFFLFIFKFRRIMPELVFCNKKPRSPCSFKRKGLSHLFNYTSLYREFAFSERKNGCFCTFNDFNTFAQLSFPSLPQLSSSFSQPCLSKTPIFLACKEREGKRLLYYLPITRYYAQHRMRSAILRNHLKR